MPQHSLHHLHRIHNKKVVNIRKPLLRSKLIKFVDKTAYLVGILGPAFTIPQIYNVWVLHEVAGVSVISWGSCFLFDIPLLLYGILHKEKLMVMIYLLWLIANFAVAFGVLIFR